MTISGRYTLNRTHKELFQLKLRRLSPPRIRCPWSFRRRPTNWRTLPRHEIFFHKTRTSLQKIITISSNLRMDLECRVARIFANWRVTWSQTISQSPKFTSLVQSCTRISFHRVFRRFKICFHPLTRVHSNTITYHQRTVASRVPRTFRVKQVRRDQSLRFDDLICLRIFLSGRSSRSDVNTSLLSESDLPIIFDQRMHETVMSRFATMSEFHHCGDFDTFFEFNELRRTRVRCVDSVVRSDDLA